MFQSLSNTWKLLGSSLHVLSKDKELLVFPIVSGVVAVVVMATFAGGVWSAGLLEAVTERAATARDATEDAGWTRQQVLMAVVGFAYYFVSYAVIIYFNAALIGAAHIRLTGGDPTVSDGFRAANACLPSILLYALIAATVGMILKAVRENSNNVVARIVVGLLGMAWTLIAFLVVPVIVIERKGAVAAVRRSASLLRHTWGEQIVSNLGFGLISLLLILPGALILVLGIGLVVSSSSAAFGLAICIVAVLYWIALGIVMSALRGIFVAALYAHTVDEPLQHFPRDVVSAAFRPR